MKMRVGRLVQFLLIPALSVVALVFVAHVSVATKASTQAAKTAKPPAAMEPVPALTPFVEEHAHFEENDAAGGVRAALAALGRENAVMVIFQISPDVFEHPGRYDSEAILADVKKHPGKLAVTRMVG